MKTKFFLPFALLALSFSAFSEPIKNLSESEESFSTEEKPFSGYSVSLGTSLLSKTDGGEPSLLEGALNAHIGKEDWRYHELFLNFSLNKEGEKERFLFEATPRLFYSFFIAGFTSYSGFGLGFGLQPYHLFSENKNIGQIFAINGQIFTGLKSPKIYNNFSFFLELNLKHIFFPFSSYRPINRAHSEIESDQEDNKELSAPEYYNNHFFHTSLNVGVSYLF